MITEGMRPCDLENQVRPLVSVDEFESKVSKSAIVLAFYCISSDSARDFRRFIHKSSVDVLDSEISPAPDAMGRYVVFLELQNDVRLGETANWLFKELHAVTGIEKWVVRVAGKSTVVELNDITSVFSKLQINKISESFGPIDSLTGVVAGTTLKLVDWGKIEEVCLRNRLGLTPVSGLPQAQAILAAQELVNEFTSVAPSPDGILLVNESINFAALLGEQKH